jgi:hypothetical protein
LAAAPDYPPTAAPATSGGGNAKVARMFPPTDDGDAKRSAPSRAVRDRWQAQRLLRASRHGNEAVHFAKSSAFQRHCDVGSLDSDIPPEMAYE